MSLKVILLEVIERYDGKLDAELTRSEETTSFHIVETRLQYVAQLGPVMRGFAHSR